ncbi:MAG TPA: DUF2267 domain-containing protein [Cyclobacteriaceae bacterium]|jgi:uncharacterized protein (DUF2267 family)|nr:DUF2267 domain-containing protein [Cyclobacteriaceae bacterium]
MPLDFETYAQKGNEFVNLLMKNLGVEDERDRAARILRSVLRTMRNHLSLEESSDLLAQLPMAIKAVYVDGWRMTQLHRRVSTMQEFANEVLKEHGNAAWRDFSNPDEVILAVRAVVETLAEYVSVGELEQAFASLPKELREQFKVWIP